MKKFTTSIGAMVLIALMSFSALADNGRGPYSPSHNSHRHGRHHSSGGDWIAPLLFLGVAGAILSAAASDPRPEPPPTYYVTPRPTYIPPVVTYVETPSVVAVPPPAPANTWYFCQSVGKYYPYTQHCPEGWQPVAAQPQSLPQ